MRIENNVMKRNMIQNANLIIFISWFIYTVSYLGKVNYSANITQIVEFYQISKAEAGVVPSFFFFAYGIGQVVNGLLCRKYNIKWSIFISLFTSALINLIIGFTTSFGIIKWLWMINGFVLSILWPTVVRLLSDVLPQKDLDRSSVVMGTTVAAGTLIIYGLSSIFALFSMFKLAFYTAALMDAIAAVLWLCFYNKAVRMALEERSKETQVQIHADTKQNSYEKNDGRSVVYVTICMLCIYAIIVNLTKDGLTTWVPSILKDEFAISDSLSIFLTLMLPMIAILGNFGALKMHHVIPDYVTHCFVVFVVLGGMVGVIIASISFKHIVMTMIGLVMVNFLASSLNSLITSIFPIFMRGKINSGLFAGVLNGFCYVGSTISSYGLGAVADHYGWISVFWLLIGCCALAGMLWCMYIYIRRIFL